MVSKQDQATLRNQVDEAFTNFIAAYSAFSEEEVNKLFPPSGWTPSQVATHMIMGSDGVPDETTGPTERPYDEMIAKIKPWWEDFSQKFQAPEFLQPGDEPRDRAEVLTQLRNAHEKDLSIIDSKDLSVTCKDFELPGMGYITRYEWLWFIQAHLKRHEFQLKNMRG